MDQDTPRRETKIIALGNQKGGVGKTTNTVHLAAALAERGYKCLIFDLDMNHGATRHFGVPADSFLGTFEVLTGDERPTDVILTKGDADVNLPDNIDLIPSRRMLEKIDQALAAKNKFLVTQNVLVEPLQSLIGQYDFIFLDTAPNATTPTIAAYKAAEYFILSAFPDPFAISGLNDALSDIQAAQQNGNARLRLLGVILSGVDKRTTLANSLAEYVEKIFSADGKKSAKFETTIGRSTVIPQCQDVGRTLFQTHPTHKVTQQYRDLATEVEARIVAMSGGGEIHRASAPAEPVTHDNVTEAVAANG